MTTDLMALAREAAARRQEIRDELPYALASERVIDLLREAGRPYRITRAAGPDGLPAVLADDDLMFRVVPDLEYVQYSARPPLEVLVWLEEGMARKQRWVTVAEFADLGELTPVRFRYKESA